MKKSGNESTNSDILTLHITHTFAHHRIPPHFRPPDFSSTPHSTRASAKLILTKSINNKCVCSTSRYVLCAGLFSCDGLRAASAAFVFLPHCFHCLCSLHCVCAWRIISINQNVKFKLVCVQNYMSLRVAVMIVPPCLSYILVILLPQPAELKNYSQ